MPSIYKTVTAEELQKICNHLDSLLPVVNEETEINVLNYIDSLPFNENIKLQPEEMSPFKEYKLSFTNFKIEEYVKIEFLNQPNIEFVNNIFLDNAKITVNGKITEDADVKNENFADSDFTAADFIGKVSGYVGFSENRFLQSFKLHVYNVSHLAINYNGIIHLGIFFYFTDLPEARNLRKTSKTPSGAQIPELFIFFSENVIQHLNITDKSDPLIWDKQGITYPSEKIIFNDDNLIMILIINTKYTMLDTHSLKADITKISFEASDKIGISSSLTNTTDNITALPTYKNNDYQLTYGEFFSLLEKQASEQHNRANEELYKRKSRYFYRKFLPQWQDKLIFYWTNLVSRDGTSWVRPIVCLVLTEMILAAIAWYFLIQWNLYYSWQEGGRVFLTLLTWFMNPASLLPLPLTLDPKTIANSWLIYLLFLLQKASVAVFYYETIKALRRFTK